MAIAYRAGSNLKGLSLTDWDVLRIDKHAKKVIVTVVVAYLTFLCVGVYLALLASEDLRLWALRLKNLTTPSGERYHPRWWILCLLNGERALAAFS